MLRSPADGPQIGAASVATDAPSTGIRLPGLGDDVLVDLDWLDEEPGADLSDIPNGNAFSAAPEHSPRSAGFAGGVQPAAVTPAASSSGAIGSRQHATASSDAEDTSLCLGPTRSDEDAQPLSSPTLLTFSNRASVTTLEQFYGQKARAPAQPVTAGAVPMAVAFHATVTRPAASVSRVLDVCASPSPANASFSLPPPPTVSRPSAPTESEALSWSTDAPPVFSLGFATASGKKKDVSAAALDRARQMFADDCLPPAGATVDGLAGGTTGESSEQPTAAGFVPQPSSSTVSTASFSSASGKKISVNPDALKRFRAMFAEEFPSAPDTVEQASAMPKRGGDSAASPSPAPALPSISFSTASGKKKAAPSPETVAKYSKLLEDDAGPLAASAECKTPGPRSLAPSAVAARTPPIPVSNPAYSCASAATPEQPVSRKRPEPSSALSKAPPSTTKDRRFHSPRRIASPSVARPAAPVLTSPAAAERGGGGGASIHPTTSLNSPSSAGALLQEIPNSYSAARDAIATGASAVVSYSDLVRLSPIVADRNPFFESHTYSTVPISNFNYHEVLIHKLGASPLHATAAWTEHHTRLIQWKLYSVHRSFRHFLPSVDVVAAPQRVLDQLCHRYNLEFCRKKTSSWSKHSSTGLSALLQSTEGVIQVDSVLVVVVCEIVQMTGELILSDGWSTIHAIPDVLLLEKVIRRSKIDVGHKLRLTNVASFSPDVHDTIRISYNSTRRARWNERLGLHRNRVMRVSLQSVREDGGPIPCLELSLFREYPVLFVEKLQQLEDEEDKDHPQSQRGGRSAEVSRAVRSRDRRSENDLTMEGNLLRGNCVFRREQAEQKMHREWMKMMMAKLEESTALESPFLLPQDEKQAPVRRVRESASASGPHAVAATAAAASVASRSRVPRWTPELVDGEALFRIVQTQTQSLGDAIGDAACVQFFTDHQRRSLQRHVDRMQAEKQRQIDAEIARCSRDVSQLVTWKLVDRRTGAGREGADGEQAGFPSVCPANGVSAVLSQWRDHVAPCSDNATGAERGEDEGCEDGPRFGEGSAFWIINSCFSSPSFPAATESTADEGMTDPPPGTQRLQSAVPANGAVRPKVGAGRWPEERRLKTVKGTAIIPVPRALRGSDVPRGSSSTAVTSSSSTSFTMSLLVQELDSLVSGQEFDYRGQSVLVIHPSERETVGCSSGSGGGRAVDEPVRVFHLSMLMVEVSSLPAAGVHVMQIDPQLHENRLLEWRSLRFVRFDPMHGIYHAAADERSEMRVMPAGKSRRLCGFPQSAAKSSTAAGDNSECTRMGDGGDNGDAVDAVRERLLRLVHYARKPVLNPAERTAGSEIAESCAEGTAGTEVARSTPWHRDQIREELELELRQDDELVEALFC